MRETGNKLNLERLAGVASFRPEGESGWISLGDVVMHKPAHEREVKSAYWHTRQGTKEIAREDVTKTDLIWSVDLQEHTVENDAILLFGSVGANYTQQSAVGTTVTLAAVAKRRMYPLGSLNVSSVKVYGPSVNISTIATGATTSITTAAAHGLATGDTVTIAGVTGNTPSTINGNHTVTVTNATVFTIAINTTVAGTGGTVKQLFTQGTRDTKNQVTPAAADYVLDAALGEIYVRDDGKIDAAMDLTVVFNTADLTMGTITPLTHPQRDGRFRLAEFDGYDESGIPNRIIEFDCNLSPESWGEQGVDGDPNKFTLKITATSTPDVKVRTS